MSIGVELLKEHRYRELWQRYCGFIDLSLPDFMGIQHRRMQEQLELLSRCELGQRFLGDPFPRTVEEFRRQVPLTTYDDYIPYLQEQQDEALPAKAALWQRTSGASSENFYKWAPITERMYEEMAAVVYAILIFATSRRRYDINFGEEEHLLYALAPPPYATGCWGRRIAEELPVTFMPSLEEAEGLSYEERLQRGVYQGVMGGIDLLFGLPSILVAIGEHMGQERGSLKLSDLVAKPGSLLRIAKAVARSKLARRPLRPKDLWSLRGLATAGTDASIYRQRIKELWGKTPLDVYGCTEGLVIATQTWDYEGMTFLPHLNFLEFIPQRERELAATVPGYQPSTVLLDEVEPGENYELVITNFNGGPFVRYRLGDLVTITARRNEALDIDLPQMSFYSRCDGIIDLDGFTRFTERTIAHAVNQLPFPVVEWTARKEFVKWSPALHVYLEPKEGVATTTEEVVTALYEHLKPAALLYGDIQTLRDQRPLMVTLLSPGSFAAYIGHQRAAGADLAHIKPPHISPSDRVVGLLLGTPEPVPTAPVGASR